MKLKITWPFAIIAALIAFIAFILFFVIKATVMPEYDHHLITDEYYKDELNYQQEIDRMNNAGALESQVEVFKSNQDLHIKFPDLFDADSISGTISFIRLSNPKIDFELPIALKSNTLILPKEKLVDGRWNIEIDWKVGETLYLQKEKIIF